MSGPSSRLPLNSTPGIARSRSDWITGSKRARRGATAPARDDQVQADVPGLREQRLQRGDRRARRCRDQVVVVDHDEHLGPAPPRAPAQLVGGDAGPGQPGAQVRRQLVERGAGLVGRSEVVQQLVLGHLAEQGTAVVDDDELGLRRSPGAGDLVEVGAQQRTFARPAVTEDQEVRRPQGRARPVPAAPRRARAGARWRRRRRRVVRRRG